MSPANAEEAPIPVHITAQNLLIPTIKAWRYYLDDQGASPHTIKAFIADMRLLASYLPADRTLGSITTFDINNFLDWLQAGRGVPCSPKTLARRITSIKAFFRWLHQNGVVLIDPAEKVPQKSVISPLPTVLTSQETQAVLDAAEQHRRAARPDARSYALLALLLATGIKKGECLALSPNHVDLQAEAGPLLFVRYASPQNRYKERKIALPDSWIQAYQEYSAQYELGERLFPWSPRRLEYLLEDLGEEAGLEKHLSFDMCRWTCALNDWQSGMDHNKIRQKLGVSKIQWREISMKLERLSSS
ncbi:MAG: tyrosine-type recombinase/integrase [Chloroflexota bacterium]